MVTIEKYVGQNEFERNPGAAQFVFLRCASIFAVIYSEILIFKHKARYSHYGKPHRRKRLPFWRRANVRYWG
jgi:hypothetical protein